MFSFVHGYIRYTSRTDDDNNNNKITSVYVVQETFAIRGILYYIAL